MADVYQTLTVVLGKDRYSCSDCGPNTLCKHWKLFLSDFEQAATERAAQEPSVDLLTAINSLERIHAVATERWRRGPVDIERNLDDIVTIAGRTIANFAHTLVERARADAIRGKGAA